MLELASQRGFPGGALRITSPLPGFPGHVEGAGCCDPRGGVRRRETGRKAGLSYGRNSLAKPIGPVLWSRGESGAPKLSPARVRTYSRHHSGPSILRNDRCKDLLFATAIL